MPFSENEKMLLKAKYLQDMANLAEGYHGLFPEKQITKWRRESKKFLSKWRKGK
jgi:hypothetical protein